MIAPLSAEHVDQVAALHGGELTGLLSELGESAATAFYSGSVRSGETVGFVYLQEGRVGGFVFGSVHPERIKSAAVRNRPFQTASGLILGILRKPSALGWLVKSFAGPDEGTYDGLQPELTYLAVSPESRKAGVGGQLVAAFTSAMREVGVSGYELSVDDGNERAISFYEGRGFELIGRYREFGRLHRRYRLRLDGVRGAGPTSSGRSK